VSVSARRLGGISITPARAVLAVAVVVLVVTPNLWLAARSIGLVFGGTSAVDWQQYVEASHRFWAGGELYAITGDYAYRYSPLFAALLSVLVPLGVVGWRLLHLAAALALPNWPMRLVALASWPFWYDVQTGNIIIFIVLAGAWALRGNRWGAAGFLLLTLLVPRADHEGQGRQALRIGQRRTRQQVEPVEPELRRESEGDQRKCRCGADPNGETPPVTTHREPEQTDARTDLGQQQSRPHRRPPKADDD
jgi:hypothetical protein